MFESINKDFIESAQVNYLKFILFRHGEKVISLLSVSRLGIVVDFYEVLI